MSNRDARSGPAALALAEEAVHLVRSAPLWCWAAYLCGTVPFTLAALFFWNDMAHHAGAEERLPWMALLVTVAFVWMKPWQTLYCRGLAARARREDPSGAGIGLRTVLVQTLVQPTAWVVLPLAALVTFPFPWIYGFYQNMTVLDDGSEPSARALARRAWTQALLWPRQHLILLWLLSPAPVLFAGALYLALVPVLLSVIPDWTHGFVWVYAVIAIVTVIPLAPLGIVLALNFYATLQMAPGMLKTLLGIETLFVQSEGALEHSTLYAVLCALVCLCLDPFMKAVYVLRCHYGESLRTGEDLRAALRALRAGPPAVLLVLAALLAAPGAAAQEVDSATIAPAALDEALRDVLAGAEYVWRLPRDTSGDTDEVSLLQGYYRGVADTLKAALKKIGDWYEAFQEWLDRASGRRPDRARDGSAWPLAMHAAGYLLLALLLAAAVLLLLVLWKRRHAGAVEAVAVGSAVTPDLNDESTSPDDLPEDGWTRLALELLQKGETRLALRAFFLAGIAALAGRGLLTVARFKSNRDYLADLERRAHAEPGVPDAFRENMRRLESVWYGSHPATDDLADTFVDTHRRMLGHG
jgi:hypothetical protein